MMTFNNNEKDFQEKLQKDTEIPVIVHERINQAYRLIENNTAVQKKAPKDPYHWMKIGGRIAGGAAAVLLIAFVFYMTDPVMAKNIPVVGGLFETLQNNVSFFGDFADHATTLEAVDGVDAEGNNIKRKCRFRNRERKVGRRQYNRTGGNRCNCSRHKCRGRNSKRRLSLHQNSRRPDDHLLRSICEQSGSLCDHAV